MKIENLSENSFYILLTGEDMKELGISFEELDYSNIETRRVIWTLLEEARNTLGRDIDPRDRMLIEVSKEFSGCKIEFTFGKSEKTGRLKIKKECPLLSAHFKNSDSLLEFSEKLVSDSLEAEIYSYLDGYAAVLFPRAGERQRLRLILSEYSVLLPDSLLFAQSVREHGRLIFRGNLKTLFA